MHLSTVFTCSALLLALLGCGEDRADGRSAGSAGAAAGAAAPATVGYETDVQPIIELGCNCHTGDNYQQLGAPFSLAASVGYANIVSAPSQQLPSMLLVSPGKLNESYLWLKLNGTQAEVGGGGARMPPIPLEQAELETFGRWIAGGAQP